MEASAPAAALHFSPFDTSAVHFMIAFRPDEALRLGEHEDAFRHERSRAALLTPALVSLTLAAAMTLVGKSRPEAYKGVSP